MCARLSFESRGRVARDTKSLFGLQAAEADERLLWARLSFSSDSRKDRSSGNYDRLFPDRSSTRRRRRARKLQRAETGSRLKDRSRDSSEGQCLFSQDKDFKEFCDKLRAKSCWRCCSLNSS